MRLPCHAAFGGCQTHRSSRWRPDPQNHWGEARSGPQRHQDHRSSIDQTLSVGRCPSGFLATRNATRDVCFPYDPMASTAHVVYRTVCPVNPTAFVCCGWVWRWEPVVVAAGLYCCTAKGRALMCLRFVIATDNCALVTHDLTAMRL